MHHYRIVVRNIQPYIKQEKTWLSPVAAWDNEEVPHPCL